MSTVTILWSMTASACLTLGLVHALAWWQRRESRAYGFFALAAICTAAIAACELLMMHADSIPEYARFARWVHIPLSGVVIALACFTSHYLNSNRLWLFWVVCSTRIFALVLNFVTGDSLNYLRLMEVKSISFLGDKISIGVGAINPWMIVGQLSNVLFLIYVFDASRGVWRRGERLRGASIGGSIVLFGILASIYANLVLNEVIHAPLSVSIFYLFVILAMGIEVSRNINRNAELSDQLKASEQRMELAADAAELGMWEWDMKNDTIWCTEKVRLLLGFSPTEKLDFEKLKEKIHPDDTPKTLEALEVAKLNGGKYHSEYRVLSNQNQDRWLVTRGQIEFSQHRTPLRMRGVSIDITARRKAEIELDRSQTELLHLSRVAMLGELSGSLAHEINQPLAAILSNAQAALRFLARPDFNRVELQDILHDIVFADQHAAEVIANLQKLLREDPVDGTPFEVNIVIMESLRLLERSLRNSDIQVVTELAPIIPRTNGSSVQIKQVVLNLLMNAMEAMANSATSSSILTIRSYPDTDGRVHIVVSDTGGGLASEDMQKLFTPFFTTKPFGLGLGLSICRSILNAHDSELNFENHPGMGMTFQFSLPLSPPSQT